MTPRPEAEEPFAGLLVAAAARALSADAAVLWALDEDGACPLVTAGNGSVPPPTSVVPRDSAAAPEGDFPGLSANRFLEEALASGCALVEDASSAARAVELPPGFGAALCVSLGEVKPLDHPGPGGLPGILCVYQIGPRKFTDAEIELLRTLGELTAAFVSIPSPARTPVQPPTDEDIAARSAEVERAEAERVRLAHVTAHELRSPITIAQSLLRNILKGYAGPITELQRDVLDRVSAQLDYLSHLVNDFLDLAATKAEGFASQEGPVVLNSSVARAVLVLQPRAEEKGISLSFRPCREELVVWASEEGLDHIFHNLVENAVKYTPPGGWVMVSIARSTVESGTSQSEAASSIGEGQARVTIADTGIGIPVEAQAHLFEEFYRAPNARAYNAVGTGLGLAIAKGLVDRYHGRIEVQSIVGQGTTFTVAVPLHQPHPDRPI
jgi:signal transduction histidine kinase